MGNKHIGMTIKSANGNQAHVLADPEMSDETKNMLSKLIDIAYKRVEQRISCHYCQGGGCPDCNGYGYI